MPGGTIGSEGTSTFVGWDQLGRNLREALRNQPPGYALSHFFQFRMRLDHQIEHRDRRGHLQCIRSIRDGAEGHDGRHEQEVKETDRTVTEIAEEFAKEIGASIETSLGGELSLAGNKLTQSLKSSLNAKRTTRQSIKTTIESILQTTSKVQILNHGPLCKELLVPWGYISITYLKGVVVVRRGFTLDSEFNVTWTDRLEIDWSQVDVDHSVDLRIFPDEEQLKKVRCDRDPADGVQHGEGQDGATGGDDGGGTRTRSRPREYRSESRSSMLPTGETYYMVRTVPMAAPEPRSSELVENLPVDAELAESLAKAGLGELGSLAHPEPGLRVEGIDSSRLAALSDMAAIKLWHPQLDGEDVEILVSGLGLRSERDLAFGYGTRSKSELPIIAKELGLEADKDRQALVELLGMSE